MTSTTKARRGVSLLETMIVVSIIGILASIAVPRFEQAVEQSRANIAAANLRAIWAGQRAFWLQNVDGNNNNTFAPDLATLLAQTTPLIDQALVNNTGSSGAPAPGPTYTYQISQWGESTFTATAVRINSSACQGTLQIDQDGLVSGTIQMTTGSGPVTINPAFP